MKWFCVCVRMCVCLCARFVYSTVLHANSSQCEQMLVSNTLGSLYHSQAFLGSSALRRSPQRCLNCFIERNTTKDTQARSGCQEHTLAHIHKHSMHSSLYTNPHMQTIQKHTLAVEIHKCTHPQSSRVPGNINSWPRQVSNKVMDLSLGEWCL